MEERCDVIIIGGGAMGLSTAYWAASSAHVVLLERFSWGHERGASHGGERIFRYAYTDPVYVEMAVAADDVWMRVERDAGRQLIERVGCVNHGDDLKLEALAQTAGSVGVAIERMSSTAAARRWPAMRFETDVLLQPTAGWVRADEAITCLAELATGHGADLRFDTQVLAIEAEDDKVRVHTATGTIMGTVVVLTAGAWTTDLLPKELSTPILTTTEEHVFFFQPRLRTGANDLPSFVHAHDRIRYGLPAKNGLVKLGEDHTGAITTGDSRTFQTDSARLARIERYVADWLPGLSPKVVTSKTCLYTSTSDQSFILDRHGPIVVGAGFSGHGFKFAPEIGRHLASLAVGDDTPSDRFALARHIPT